MLSPRIRRPRSCPVARVLQRKRECAGPACGCKPAADLEAAGTRGGATALPDRLKDALEDLSGFDLSGVRVHRDSPEPGRIAAHAFAAGADIHLSSGQQHHLSHEAWHVVQQMQGRVRPTGQWSDRPFNDDPALELEAEALGAQAEHLAAHPEKEGAPRESPAGAGNIALSGIGQACRVIQRVARFDKGTKHPTLNLATRLLSDDAYVGKVIGMLNGKPAGHLAAAAVKAPVLRGQTGSGGIVSVRVETVPENAGSYRMYLPAPPPWFRETTRARFRFVVRRMDLEPPRQCAEPGETSFTVNGQPNDQDFAETVHTHELRHAMDVREGFDSVVGAWNGKLERARLAGTRYYGPDEAFAEAALYGSVGGTPAQIGRALVDMWAALGEAAHLDQTIGAAGGPIQPLKADADVDCSGCSLDVA